MSSKQMKMANGLQMDSGRNRITVADCDIERLFRDRQAVEPIELTHVDEFSTTLSKPGDNLKRRQCYL
jgi:hypothetical protein